MLSFLICRDPTLPIFLSVLLSFIHHPLQQRRERQTWQAPLLVLGDPWIWLARIFALKTARGRRVPNHETPAPPESRGNGTSRVGPQRISLMWEIQRNPKAHPKPKTKLAATKKIWNKALKTPTRTESPANTVAQSAPRSQCVKDRKW